MDEISSSLQRVDACVFVDLTDNVDALTLEILQSLLRYQEIPKVNLWSLIPPNLIEDFYGTLYCKYILPLYLI